MRDRCKQALRVYMSKRFRQERCDAGLTQARFADQLMMDGRCYAALEAGSNLCSTVTFVMYLVFFCKDRDAFIEELRQVILDAGRAEPED